MQVGFTLPDVMAGNREAIKKVLRYHRQVTQPEPIIDNPEDTEEERKMPLAIMQGYMTIIQVRVVFNSKSVFRIDVGLCQSLSLLNIVCINHFHRFMFYI